MKKYWVLSVSFSAQQRLWSDCMGVQADLSLRREHMPFCWFYHAVAQSWIVFRCFIHFYFIYLETFSWSAKQTDDVLFGIEYENNVKMIFWLLAKSWYWIKKLKYFVTSNRNATQTVKGFLKLLNRMKIMIEREPECCFRRRIRDPYEPSHDKTNKMTCGAQRRLRSDWADAWASVQSDLRVFAVRRNLCL